MVEAPDFSRLPVWGLQLATLANSIGPVRKRRELKRRHLWNIIPVSIAWQLCAMADPMSCAVGAVGEAFPS